MKIRSHREIKRHLLGDRSIATQEKWDDPILLWHAVVDEGHGVQQGGEEGLLPLLLLLFLAQAGEGGAGGGVPGEPMQGRYHPKHSLARKRGLLQTSCWHADKRLYPRAKRRHRWAWMRESRRVGGSWGSSFCRQVKQPSQNSFGFPDLKLCFPIF